MEINKLPREVHLSLKRVARWVKDGSLSAEYGVGYKEGIEIMHKENETVKTKCDRYEKALKRIKEIDHGAEGITYALDLIGDVVNEALSGEGENPKDGLEWLNGDQIEFCYRHPDGRIEVKYRRIEGTPECDAMIKEVYALIEKAKPNVSPYFYRKENQKEDQQ